MTLLLDAARAVTAPLRCALTGHAEPVVSWVGGDGWTWALTCPRCGQVWRCGQGVEGGQ